MKKYIKISIATSIIIYLCTAFITWRFDFFLEIPKIRTGGRGLIICCLLLKFLIDTAIYEIIINNKK